MRGCSIVYVADQCKNFILQEINSLDLYVAYECFVVIELEVAALLNSKCLFLNFVFIYINCALVKYYHNLNVYNTRTN